MVFDISKKFLIFDKNHLFGHFFRKKNREKFRKNPDRAGQESSTGPGRPVTGAGYNSDVYDQNNLQS
jgi:hypothetical protein